MEHVANWEASGDNELASASNMEVPGQSNQKLAGAKE